MQAMKELQTADEVSQTEPDEQLFEVRFFTFTLFTVFMCSVNCALFCVQSLSRACALHRSQSVFQWCSVSGPSATVGACIDAH
jgi:hypothetical protein